VYVQVQQLSGENGFFAAFDQEGRDERLIESDDAEQVLDISSKIDSTEPDLIWWPN
jgi:hypothetical protein